MCRFYAAHMAHEHDGGCCEQHHEQLEIEHLERLGRLCCAGRCEHEEHHAIAAFIEREQLQQTERTEVGYKRTSKKKKLPSWAAMTLLRPSQPLTMFKTLTE
jgi:hypothetical protein